MSTADKAVPETGTPIQIEEISEPQPPAQSQAHFFPAGEPEAYTLAQLRARQPVNGEAMQRLTVKRKTAVQSARLAGIVPFTVVNFNPVEAKVECGLIDYSVPPAGSGLGIQKRLQFDEQWWRCSVLVISNEKGFPQIVSATSASGKNTPTVEYDWHVVLPIEQARVFEFEYNHPTNPGSIGGVLVFRGNFDALKAPDGLIHVPDCERMPDNTLVYVTRAVKPRDKIAELLGRQKAYCTSKMDRANEWFHDDRPELHGSIDRSFHVWGQFAIDHGWRHKEELPWMLSREAGPGCKKCGKAKQNGTALFCQCGHPYDAYGAYMAGHEVEVNLLATLPPEQLEAVKREAARRRELAAVLNGESRKKS